jgi:hypothetical protein
MPAADKSSVPLEEKNALTIFYVCALDLLAQTEAQHRAGHRSDRFTLLRTRRIPVSDRRPEA